MSPAGKWGTASVPALRVLGAWLLVSLVLHLTWEIAQLPLYTLWREETPAYIAWAVIHCCGSLTPTLKNIGCSVHLRSARSPNTAPSVSTAVACCRIGLPIPCCG